MNQYHIYEKIGKGKHSTVYKGRKKKTIQYHAIKSVDKSQKPRVLQEVRTMHALDHRNILKFFAWYETTNHLWLILEYCVGGDLMSLLRQDVRLPESSIHDFGRDMVVALQCLHAHSIIYCDIKPSNILLDENGRLKLGGFGLSRRLSDINKTPVTNLPPARRGTPCYMAPELFSEGGTHSTASDLWSLGCVLYECAMGSPPFMDSSFNKLVQDILNKEPPTIPGASPEFNHLLSRLLDKNPATRIKWQELVEHPFWKVKLPLLPLSAEPALEAYIKAHNLLPAHGRVSASEAVDSLRASVDLSRLSRIALSNLEKDDATTDYAAAQPATTGTDITIDSADAELDFEEVQEQGGMDEYAAASSATDSDSSSDQRSTPGSAGNGRATGHQAVLHNTAANSPSKAAWEQPASAAAAGAASRAAERLSTGQQEPVKFLPMQQPQQQDQQQQQRLGLQQHMQQPQQQGPAVAAASYMEQPHPSPPAGAAGSMQDSYSVLLSQIWHPSDSAVKPIVANRRIERLPDPTWTAAALPFPPLSLPGMLDCDQVELERFLTQVYRTIASSVAVKEKINMLAYFETLCSDTAAANVLINSSLTVLFVRMLRNGKLPLLRVRLANVLGLLVRHATFIADELASTHLVQVLTEALGDSNERVRRRVMATLGELLFYIATQQQDSGSVSVSEASAAWGVKPDTITAVSRLLQPEEDEVCQHYAIKTIENICSQGGEWARKFASQEVLFGLVGVYQSTSTENVKATAASTLARLLRSNPSLLQPLLEHCGPHLLLRGLNDSSSKVQVSAANMLNLALSQPSLAPQLPSALLADEKVLLSALCRLLDHSLALLRAKALVTVMLLCRCSTSWLLRCCQNKLVVHVERLARDKDTYIQDALGLLNLELAAAVRTICSDLDASLGPTLQQSSGASSNSNSSCVDPAAHDQLYVVLSLVTSPSLRSSVVTPELIGCLAKCLQAACVSGSQQQQQQRPQDSQQLASFRATLLQVLEAVSMPEHTSLFPGVVLNELMPALCSAIASSSSDSSLSDTRFFCLRIISDCLAMYLTSTDMQASNSSGGGGIGMVVATDRDSAAGAEGSRGSLEAGLRAALDRLLRRHVVPLVPVLLELEDPMPLYALKLLGGILDVNSSYVSMVDDLGLSPCFFRFLALDHPNNNVHNIRLCRQLVLSGRVSTQQLMQLQAADKVCAVLCYAQQNDVEPFLEPVLLLAHAVMMHDTPSLAGGSSSGLLLLAFLPHVLTFLDLCTHADSIVALAAAQCLEALVAAYPADAGSSLLGESGAQLLIKALQTPPDAAPLQQQLLSALCSVVATGEAVLDSQDAAQLQAAVHALLSSPDACVAAAASAALGWLERVRCLVAQ